MSFFFCLQLRDYIINQTTGDREISVKYHYDNIVIYFFINQLFISVFTFNNLI